MEYKAVIFDMDGTLVDSLKDLADSANDMLKFYGFPQHDTEEYRYFVGNGPRKLMERCLPAECASDELFLDDALDHYQRYYSVRMLRKTKPYRGIRPMLKRLRREHVPLAICTNKQQPAAKIIAEKMFPADTFCEIVGTVPGEPRKPDPSRALLIAEHLGVRPEEVLFLGDSSVDIETARNAGFHAVGVSWGFRPEEELIESGAQTLLHQPGELFERFIFWKEGKKSKKRSESNQTIPVENEAEDVPMPQEENMVPVEEEAKTAKYFFVDYENVNAYGLTDILELDGRDKVWIFYSDNAPTIPIDLHVKLHQCKAAIYYQKAELGHKNALDFQLASFLGFTIRENMDRSDTECFLVTRDAAFESLVQFWIKKGQRVRMIPSISAAGQNSEDPAADGETVEEELFSGTDERVERQVRNFIGDKGEADFIIDCVRKYGTKQAVHSALQKKYHNDKARNIYRTIRSILK